MTKAPPGKGKLLSPRQSWCTTAKHASSDASYSQGLRPLQPVTFFFKLISELQCFIPRSLYLRPSAEVVFRGLCWGLLPGEMRGNPWGLFPSFWLNIQNFSTLRPSFSPSSWPQTLGTIKLPEPFVQGFLKSKMTPHCGVLPDPGHEETRNIGSQCSLGFRLLLYRHNKWLEASHFPFGLTALTGFSNS